MTYSIVARDPQTGDLGIGVQTHQPSVGAIVPWVKAGVGAVATQSYVNPKFGPQGLALLETGLDPDRTLAALLAADTEPEVRQLAIIDATGRVAVHTGSACIPFAGHRTGEGYSVQANMMLNDTVPGAMAAAFESATGHLASRILFALEAAQGEGGDIRGSQSAAILIRHTTSAEDFLWNLRVDNDPEPLAKLRTLVDIRLAEETLDAATTSSKDIADPVERLRALRDAYARANELAPSDEQTFWFAVSGLAPLGQLDEAQAILAPIFDRSPAWRELLLRLRPTDIAPLQDRYR
ncbi:MAG TPA: DUF1028 domain-containing protein [Tepidiformaceae bacterium]